MQGLSRLGALALLLSPAVSLAQAPATDAPASSAAEPPPAESSSAEPSGEAPASEAPATEEPASEEAAAEEAAAPEVPTVRVHVLSLRPGVEAHVRLGTHVVTTESTSHVADDYVVLCQPTPCDAVVPAGLHLFAVSGTAGTPLPVRELDLSPDVEHTLRIDLDDRGAVRTAGILMMLLGGIPGLAVLLTSIIGPAFDHSPAVTYGRIDAVFVAVGASLTAVGIAGIPFAFWGDTRVIALDEGPDRGEDDDAAAP